MTRENRSILNCAAMAKPHLHLHYSLLVLSTVSNYHYHFKHTVSRFDYECVQRSRQVTLFCIFGTEITESFIITNWIFFKPYTDNCFIFRMLALLFLSCCWEHTDWLIQSCRSAQICWLPAMEYISSLDTWNRSFAIIKCFLHG